jgi:ribose-phosphate pyrophosphokinase
MIWIDGKLLEIKRFPDGEFNVWGTVAGINSDLPEYVRNHTAPKPSRVTLKWETDGDLFVLMLLKKAVPSLKTLNILFLPYSREDRGPNGSSNCSLRYIGKFVEDLGFEEIEVLDPHSDLTLAYLGTKASSYYPDWQFDSAVKGLSKVGKPIILFPDAGAQKRYSKMWSQYEQIVGYKTRDFATGKITGYQIPNAERANLSDVVIVDDLCSYGGTFMAAAKALNDPLSLWLLVTHCEHSIFKGEIFKPDSPFTGVITTDSIITRDSFSLGTHGLVAPSNLTVIELPK